jgi:hypothetical protein
MDGGMGSGMKGSRCFCWGGNRYEDPFDVKMRVGSSSFER